MDPHDKDATRNRAMRGAKHQKTREDRRLLKERARARKAHRKKAVRKKHWSPNEENDTPFEKIKRLSDPVLGRGAETESRGPTPAGPSPEETLPAQASGAAPPPPELIGGGTLVALLGARARVLDAAGELLLAEIAPGLPRLVVGDRVHLQPRDGALPRIALVEARRSILARRDPGRPERARPLVANVDLGVVVLSVVAPPLRPRLLDRFLTALEPTGIEPVLCVNKVDLLPDAASRQALEKALRPYRELGHPVHLVSAGTGEGIEGLREALCGSTAVFVGHSGVGKSSLLNALDPDGERATGRVRTSDGKGRHTTTASDLRSLENGTRVIDTPGVRAFGLWAVAVEDLHESFPELAAAAEACRFRDCSHTHEPDCEVRRRVAAGAISAERFQAYQGLLEELGAEE